MRRILLDLAVSTGTPPTEFRVFRLGENTSTKGTFVLTPEACERIASEWRDRGVDCSIDYEHKAWSVLAPDSTAAGWCRIEARADGLWCVNVQWTEAAAAKLAAREYRYFSPAFGVDDSDPPQITSLLNIALTNVPALDRIEPLAASQFDQLVAAVAGRLAPPTPTQEARTMDEAQSVPVPEAPPAVEPAPPPAVEPSPMRRVALALAVAEDTAEDTILAAVATLRADNEVLRAQMAEVVSLRARIAEADARDLARRTADATAAVEALVADDRIPQAGRSAAVKLALDSPATFAALYPQRTVSLSEAAQQRLSTRLATGSGIPAEPVATPTTPESHSDQAHKLALELRAATPTLSYEDALMQASRQINSR